MACWQKGTIFDGMPGGRVAVDPNGADDIRFLSPKFVLNDGSDYGIVGYGLDLGTDGGEPAPSGFAYLIDATGQPLAEAAGHLLIARIS